MKMLRLELLCLLFCSLLFISSVNPSSLPSSPTDESFGSTQDDGVEGTDERPVTHIPVFKSKPQTLYTNEGETVRLECEVDNLDPYILMWQKGGEYLRAGNVVMTKNDRYDTKLTTLTIKDFQKEDEGNYTCQISANKPLILAHTIHIKTPPKIHPHPHHKDIEVKEGEHVVLRCPSDGQPPPTIVWQNEELPLRPNSGVLKHNNVTLEFSKIKGTDAGQYECVADNGVATDRKEFVVKVKHSPIVMIEKQVFPVAVGANLDLVCVVKADPAAQIHWSKDGKDVSSNPRVVLKPKDNRLTLKIPSVKEEDFGKYKCEAKNMFGSSMKETDVAGSLRDQTATDTQSTTAPETVNEWKSRPNGTNGSPPLEQRAKVVAVMTVIILIAFF